MTHESRSFAASGDRGAADPLVRAALAASGDDLGYLRAVVALCTARLLMPLALPDRSDRAGALPDGRPGSSRRESPQQRAADSTDPGRRESGPEPATGSRRSTHPEARPEFAAVSVQNEAGERTLLAFTGLDALQAWRADARPLPCTIDELAATVGEAGSDALLIDVAGPFPMVIGPDLLDHFSRGRRLVELPEGDFGWMFVANPGLTGDSVD